MITKIDAIAATLRPAIAEAAKQAVSKMAPPLDWAEAGEIADRVTRDVSAVVVNQTNQEPWYQSTVTIGAAITLITGGYALGYDFLDGTVPTPAEFAPAAGPVIGALITLYGRWFQRKPLGA
jgi:hypothetical protein